MVLTRNDPVLSTARTTTKAEASRSLGPTPAPNRCTQHPTTWQANRAGFAAPSILGDLKGETLKRINSKLLYQFRQFDAHRPAIFRVSDDASLIIYSEQ